MGTPEWAPIQSDTLHDDPNNNLGAPTPNGTALDAPAHEVLSLDDPAFTSEVIEVRADADVYAQPAPPPDGRYRFKLKLAKSKYQDKECDYYPAKWGQGGNSQMVAVACVEATLLDPSGTYDGLRTFDRTVSTYYNQRSKGTKVQSILHLLKQPDGKPWLPEGKTVRWTTRQWMDTLVRALAGEPEIGGVTIWTWSCQKCGEDAKKNGTDRPRDIRGMSKFPTKVEKGQVVYQPEMPCEVNKAHGWSRGRFEIAQFIPLSEIGGRP